MIAEQLVFGYRDGHRQLGGSIDLEQNASAALLGATDASVGTRTERLITALPLPSAGFYALCGTWSAPDAGRPGAVWAHALLVPLDTLGELEHLEAVALALRRPSHGALPDFARPIQVQHHLSVPAVAPPYVVAQLLAAAIEPEGIPVVATNDLAGGEAALFALWNSAWPELRAILRFRTRERVKATPELGYICVARRITGMWRPQAAAAQSHASALAQSNWLGELAQGQAPHRGSGLRQFLRAFGPEGVAELGRLVELGKLHDAVRRGSPRRVARMLATDYPKATDAASLKRALFGRTHAEWWDAAELDVVLAIFGVGAKGFDVKALDLAARVRKLVATGHGIELIEVGGVRRAQRLRALLRDTLVQEATPLLLCDVMSADAELGEAIAMARPDLLEARETWSAVTEDQAATLAKVAKLSDGAIAAAVLAGRFALVEPIVSLPTAAVRLARARELRALRKLFEGARGEGLGKVETDELRIQVAAAGVEAGSLGELLDALEARRHHVDDAWLRAAVHALDKAGKKRQRSALEVVFGPLHDAATDDRLPHDLWDTLEKIAPPARNPALRLRRLLVTRARDDHWPPEALGRALRGGGPDVKKLKAEIKGDDDDPFVATAKAVLKTWKRLV